MRAHFAEGRTRFEERSGVDGNGLNGVDDNYNGADGDGDGDVRGDGNGGDGDRS